MNEPTNVLITGANGYVGSVFCARLSELGYNVVAVDNGARGLNDVSRLPHLTFVNRDCREGLVDVLREYQPKLLVHFAAATGDLTRPQSELEEINVGITQRLFLESGGIKEPPIFLFPMTSLGLAIPESGYVSSKQKAVDWLLENDLDRRALLFRFFNNAGGYRDFGEYRQKEVHMFPRMFHCYKTGEPFVINGNDYDTIDGTPARDYIHVLDTVDWMIYCWGLKRGGRIKEVPTYDGLIESGRGTPLTTQQISEAFNVLAREKAVMGEGLATVIGPRRDFDCGSLCASGWEAMKNWRPLKTSSELIESVIISLDKFWWLHGSLDMK